jgi:P-type Ca2+ transporter type 2C
MASMQSQIVIPSNNDAYSGLTGSQAQSRHEQDGPNELPHRDERSTLRVAAEVLREPMLALLLVAGFTYLLLGDRLEAILLLCFATFSIGITIVQETRSEKVLAALRDLSSPRALVIRDGERLRIAGREVVVGDIIVLEQGDRVPADAKLLSASELELDESLLTGESLAVGKGISDQVFSGTLAVRGRGIGEVYAIAGQAQIGQIGAHLAAIKPEAPRLRRETGLIVRIAGIGGRDCHWHGDVARGISRRAGNVYGDGRVAYFQGRRADKARRCHRDIGVNNDIVHRQDRNIDRKPHGFGRIMVAGWRRN